MGLQQMANEPKGGAGQVVEIEVARADAGELGAPSLRGRAAFGGSDDFTDRATAETSGAEGEFLEKAVVHFLPMAFVREPLDRGLVDGINRPGEEFGKVVKTALEKVSGGDGGLKLADREGFMD